MVKLELSPENKAVIATKIQQYLQDELACEAGQFDIEFFLDFLEQTLAPSYYNQGLFDAQTILANKIETINEAISEIEMPT